MYFPRNVDDPIEKFELVGFSEKAYGCVIYFWFTRRSSEIEVSFVTSKSRVTRIEKNGKKKCTLPKCEQLENLILSQLVVSVCSALEKDMMFDEIYCFSDSEIALAWIKVPGIGYSFGTFSVHMTIDIELFI